MTSDAAGGLEGVDIAVHPPGRGRAEAAGGIALRRLGRAGVIDRVVLEVVAAGRSPASSRSCSLAWAMSRATTNGPVSETRVFTGYFDSVARMSSIGRLRSIFTTSPPRMPSVVSGRYCAGSCLQLLEEDALAGDLRLDLAVGRAATRRCRSAGRAVPRQPDHPHVVAEILAAELRADAEVLGQLVRTSASSSGSRKAWPDSLPVVGRVSSYLVLASFTVFRLVSALVPPMTIARW